MPVGLVTLISVTKPPMTSRPDEQHAARGQRRPDLRGKPAVAVVERAAHPAGAGGEVAAVVLGRGDARQRVGHRLAVDQQHARVAAVDDVGQVALHDGEAAGRSR